MKCVGVSGLMADYVVVPDVNARCAHLLEAPDPKAKL